MLDKLNLRLEIGKADRKNRATQITAYRVIKRRIIGAEAMQPDGEAAVKKRLKKRQAANMVGVKMRKANINFFTVALNHLRAQMNKTRAAVKHHHIAARMNANARGIAAKKAMVWCVHRQRAAGSPENQLHERAKSLRVNFGQ